MIILTKGDEYDNLYQEVMIIIIREVVHMPLSKAKLGQTFQVEKIEGKDKIKKFLFSLGCFEGEPITVISKLAGNYIVNIKDSRYAIDEKMAKSILLF